MSIDSACQPPADDLKIPTLRRGHDMEPCDRTDYAQAENLSLLVGSNDLLRREAAKILSGKAADNNVKAGAEVVNQAYDLNQYRLASPAVVRVNSQTEGVSAPRGSAFGVGASGGECLYITDFHVASDESRPNAKLTGLTLTGAGVDSVEARVRNLDAAHDLALLAAPQSAIGECPSLPLSPQKAAALRIGSDRILTIGHPHGSDRQFISGGFVEHTGRTHAEIAEKNKTKFWANSGTIEANLQVIAGMSGGPALADGVVVGVVQSRIGDTRAVVTPVEYVRPFLEKSPQPGNAGNLCDYEKAKSDLKAFSSQGKVISTAFDGKNGHILKHYTLSSGEQIEIDESSLSCRREQPSK